MQVRMQLIFGKLTHVHAMCVQPKVEMCECACVHARLREGARVRAPMPVGLRACLVAFKPALHLPLPVPISALPCQSLPCPYVPLAR